MALQFSTTLRNAMLDAIETTAGTSALIVIFTGSVPATPATANSGTHLVTFSLASDWANTAASGQKSLTSTPLSATANATGTAGYFRLFNTAGSTCHMQGTVTATGGGGDLIVDNTSIANTQNVQISTWVWTAPGA